VVRVSAADIGSMSETRTVIRVAGFNRNSLKADLDMKNERLQELRKELNQIRQHINVYSCSSELSEEQRMKYEKLMNSYAEIKDAIKELEYEIRNLTDDLKTPGEGAVIVRNRCYPRVRIEIKGLGEEITHEMFMTTFYYKDHSIKTL